MRHPLDFAFGRGWRKVAHWSQRMKLLLTPIRTEEDYLAALKMAEAFFDAATEPAPTSADGVSFDALVTLIEAYERRRYPITTERKPTWPDKSHGRTPAKS
ncbi:hypothetical protein ACFIQF_10340 [Comamonas sp. J-3]|uniref:hypothetical protein n=1 Tax=Comamonas trifloxystrobinivorans TaxID=3350256 RepID=UPI0037298ABD